MCRKSSLRRRPTCNIMISKEDMRVARLRALDCPSSRTETHVHDAEATSSDSKEHLEKRRHITDERSIPLPFDTLKSLIQRMHENGGATDEDILRWAVHEERIIITTDQDFEEMIWREGKMHFGVLRLENLPRAARIALLADTLKQHSQVLAEGAIIIAMSRKIRIRKGSRPDYIS